MSFCIPQWSRTPLSLVQFVDENGQTNTFEASKFQVNTALLLGYPPI